MMTVYSGSCLQPQPLTEKLVKTIVSGRLTIMEELNGYKRTTKKTTDALGNVRFSTKTKAALFIFPIMLAGEQIKAQYGNNIVTTAYDVWGRKSRFHDPPIKMDIYLRVQRFRADYKRSQPSKEKSDKPGLTNKNISISYNSKGLVTGKFPEHPMLKLTAAALFMILTAECWKVPKAVMAGPMHKKILSMITNPVYQYSFDAVKNELKERTRQGNLAISEVFTYDDNNRLIQWTNPKTGGVSSNKYDLQGRITENDQSHIVMKRETLLRKDILMHGVCAQSGESQPGLSDLAEGERLLNRGYTSHEHFEDIGIIHMNGRLYDPLLRRFLNADENIQDPNNTQNYNKYGYVLNYPLMYNDPSGEFIFGFLALWAFWKAVIIGAAIGLASYTLGLAVTGNIDKWNILGALKATFFGALSGAVTFGIGSIFSTAASGYQAATEFAKTTLGMFTQAAAHAVAQGALSLMQGGNFGQAFISGALGSLGAKGWGMSMKGLGLSDFANSTLGMVTFGALAGGIGSELSGGNFWQGALIGGVVAGLNDAMHKDYGPDNGYDKNGKKINDNGGNTTDYMYDDNGNVMSSTSVKVTYSQGGEVNSSFEGYGFRHYTQGTGGSLYDPSFDIAASEIGGGLVIKGLGIGGKYLLSRTYNTVLKLHPRLTNVGIRGQKGHWQREALIGGVVAGLNDAMHKEMGPGPEKDKVEMAKTVVKSYATIGAGLGISTGASLGRLGGVWGMVLGWLGGE
ncbi:hypothetical protein FQR65_LT17005 [Abscondita terminalis]|nr:hypothetical protein FQR65_LT17005 [Abscondita terminalis]